MRGCGALRGWEQPEKSTKETLTYGLTSQELSVCVQGYNPGVGWLQKLTEVGSDEWGMVTYSLGIFI